MHKENILDKYGPKLVIGHVEGEEVIETQDKNAFSKVPYGEANAFLKGFHSAYYNESHIKFR